MRTDDREHLAHDLVHNVAYARYCRHGRLPTIHLLSSRPALDPGGADRELLAGIAGELRRLVDRG